MTRLARGSGRTDEINRPRSIDVAPRPSGTGSIEVYRPSGINPRPQTQVIDGSRLDVEVLDPLPPQPVRRPPGDVIDAEYDPRPLNERARPTGRTGGRVRGGRIGDSGRSRTPRGSVGRIMRGADFLSGFGDAADVLDATSGVIDRLNDFQREQQRLIELSREPDYFNQPFLVPTDPDFYGGQSTNVLYRIRYSYEAVFNDTPVPSRGVAEAIVSGPIYSISPHVEPDKRNAGIKVFANSRRVSGPPFARYISPPEFSIYTAISVGGPRLEFITIFNIQISRLDGLPDTGGNPAIDPNAKPKGDRPPLIGNPLDRFRPDRFTRPTLPTLPDLMPRPADPLTRPRVNPRPRPYPLPDTAPRPERPKLPDYRPSSPGLGDDDFPTPYFNIDVNTGTGTGTGTDTETETETQPCAETLKIVKEIKKKLDDDDCCEEILKELAKANKALSENETIELIQSECERDENGDRIVNTHEIAKPRIVAIVDALEKLTEILDDRHLEWCDRQAQPIEAIAAVPDWWQVRLDAGIPQLSIQFAEESDSYKPPKYPINIPHPAITEPPGEALIGSYDKGNYMGILTLTDNSKAIVNCSSIAECRRVLGIIEGLIDPDYLTGFEPKIGPRGGQPLQEIRVTPKIGKYFPDGQKNLKPEWIEYWS